MTAVKFENYIVIGSKQFSAQMSKYSFDGHVFFPIGIPIPIIVKGVGCSALAIIDTIKFEKDTTTVYFDIKDASDSTKNAADTMYKNFEVSKGDSSDDTFVPGVYRSKSISSSSKKSKDDDMTYRPKWLK